MRKLLALAVTAAILAGACGGSGGVSGDPKDALNTALDNLAEYEGITVSMSIDSDVGSLTSSAEGETALTDEQAQMILDSSLTFSAVQGDKPEDGQLEMAVNIAGTENAVEFKVVDLTLYVRADVNSIVDTFGVDPGEVEAARQEVAGQPGFEFVGDLLDGNWVAFTGLEQAASQLGGGAVAATPSEEDQKALEEIGNVLKESTEVEEGDEEGPGTNLVVSVPLRSTYQKLQEVAGSLSGMAGTGETLPSVDSVPDKTISIDVWVEDDRLTQVSFDAVAIGRQLDEDPPEGVEKLAFVVGLAEFTGGVEAPADATEVDLMQLIQSMMGGLGDFGGGSPPAAGGGGGGDDAFCKALEDQLEGQSQDVVDAIVDQYGQQCPDLGK